MVTLDNIVYINSTLTYEYQISGRCGIKDTAHLKASVLFVHALHGIATDAHDLL